MAGQWPTGEGRTTIVREDYLLIIDHFTLHNVLLSIHDALVGMSRFCSLYGEVMF